MLAQILVLGVFPAAMAYAAASDLLTMTISNKLAVILIAGFYVVALALGMPASAIVMHSIACLAVLSVTFAMFAAGWIGGGDAKFAAAVALWLGFEQLLDYILIASMLGGALTLALLAVRRYALPLVLMKQDWVARLHAPTTGIPYGIALAGAALLVYPHGSIMRALVG